MGNDAMKKHDRGWIRVVVLLSLGWALGACSNDDEPARTTVNLPHFHDLTSAPTAIQSAAKAVVRLHTAGAYGTGAYISSTGLLLTNNHVLGQPVCASEGCYVEVSTQHQRGALKLEDKTYHAIPKAVDAGLDLAVVQLVDPETNSEPLTPNYLEFEPIEAADLVDEHVTVVGHPEANLKKWTDGTVVSSSGKWFTASTYILPGDSGSPVLNDAGRIVGLVHRGPASLDLVTDQGVNVYSIGTASAPIKDALTAPLPTTMVSVAAATTEDEFVQNEEIYLNARSSNITIGTATAPAIDILGRACDAALADKDYLSLDELDEMLAPCTAARTWIECRQDAPAVPYGVVCPVEADRVTWRSRFQSVNQVQIQLNGMADYYSVGPAIARLETSKADGTTAGAQSLKQLLDATSPQLNFELAYYLAVFAISSYDSVNIGEYVLEYSKQPHYELYADYIAYAATWLAGNNAVAGAQVLALLKNLMGDPNVSVGAKLAIEDLQYEIGAI
jgi:V8-like Glu-specific endopeptidase